MIGIPDSTYGKHAVLLSQNKQLVYYAVPLISAYQCVQASVWIIIKRVNVHYLNNKQCTLNRIQNVASLAVTITAKFNTSGFCY